MISTLLGLLLIGCGITHAANQQKYSDEEVRNSFSQCGLSMDALENIFRFPHTAGTIWGQIQISAATAHENAKLGQKERAREGVLEQTQCVTKELNSADKEHIASELNTWKVFVPLMAFDKAKTREDFVGALEFKELSSEKAAADNAARVKKYGRHPRHARGKGITYGEALNLWSAQNTFFKCLKDEFIAKTNGEAAELKCTIAVGGLDNVIANESDLKKLRETSARYED